MSLERVARAEPGDLAAALADCEIVDLSVSLEERKPVSWPGATPFQHHPFNTYDDRQDKTPIRGGPYLTHTVLLDEHCGTHFDAPSHFIPPPESGLPHAGPAGAITGDKVALGALMGPAAVVDCRHLATDTPGASPIITPDVVEEHERIHGPIRPGDAVLFQTGWDAAHFRDRHEHDGYLDDPFTRRSAPGWPAPDVEIAQHLHAKGVRLLATDGTSMGPVHDGAPVHLWGLANGMVFVEGATGFDRLPPRGAYFVFLPVKIAGSTGGPGRAIAFVPRNGTT